MIMPRIVIAVKTTARIECGVGAAETTVTQRLVDDYKKRPEDARDKNNDKDPKEKRRDFSPHPARDRSSNCECTQVDDDYTSVCAFLDAAPAANEADRADDRLLSASIPHSSRNPRIPSLHVDVLPDTGVWSAEYVNK